MTDFVFRKATKDQEKLRMALDGPPGGGKTWTSLIIGTYLAEREGGRIAVIDSERSSAKKYARDFDFDHLTLPDNDPRTYASAVRAAIEAGYAVIIIDSLSHAWEGTLDMKDRVSRQSQSGDSFGAWRTVTPVHNELVDTILRAPAHVIATMRTKVEYLVDPTNPDKSKRVQKVGLKPVQREGVDYEFDVVGELDQENSLVITKTRCSALSGAVIHRPDVALAKTLHEWLTDGEPVVDKETAALFKKRMDALDEEPRRACKAAFLAAFGRPEQVLARAAADASALIRTFEGENPTPPVPPADTTPNQGDGADGATTEGMPDTAAATSSGEVPAQTMPAGDAPEPDPASPEAPPPPEDQGAAASPPADGPTFTERLRELPVDLAQNVVAGEKAILQRGVEAKSQQHVDETLAVLADAEKAQVKRARDVVLAINAGAKTVWGRAATDDERHQLLLTFTNGGVASAKKVTAEQLKAIKGRVRDWQNGAISLEPTLGGEYAIREAVAS